MARLVLHIGSKKTGTTLIQACLNENPDRLAAAGWSTPDFTKNRNHAEFVLPFQDQVTGTHRHYGVATPELRAKKLQELDAQLARRVKPDSKWVISSEFFSTRLLTEEQVERAIAFLRPHFDQIDVVMFMRRQDYIMPSIYSQGVKGGHLLNWSIESFERQRPILDLNTLAGRWCAVVGRDSFHAIPYMEVKKRDPDWLLDQFARVTGIPVNSSWVPAERSVKNERLSEEGMAFLRVIDKFIPRWREDGTSNVGTRNRAVDRVVRLTPGTPFKPRAADLVAIEDSYRESNQKLVAAMPSSDDWNSWLDQPRPPASSHADVQPLSAARVAELMVAMSAPAGPLDWGQPGARPQAFRQLAAERVRNRVSRLGKR